MKDGLYQVTTNWFCAGFSIIGGKVVACAPILKKRIDYWLTTAKLIKPYETSRTGEDSQSDISKTKGTTGTPCDLSSDNSGTNGERLTPSHEREKEA
jgi:hypothetical protein